MLDTGPDLIPPLAATMDLQYRLPPMQQVLYSPTIIISAVLLGITLVVVVYLAHRARKKAKENARREALRMVERILLKRGGTPEEADRMLYAFQANPALDPAAMVMLKDKFHDELRPTLERLYDKKFGERMEMIYFPPPKDTRRMLAVQPAAAAGESGKHGPPAPPSAAIIDLMDATLRPGTMVRLMFQGVQGGYACLVMGHDMQSINLTLPANNDRLLAALKPGLRVEGTLESGPSLMAFNSTIIQAVAGSMPYCRITPWTAAWEVRKRDSIRLPISIDVDFQHISTSTTESIKISNLEKAIGTVRPGKLIDISLGGCAIETPSSAEFTIGDMIRFSKSLVTGNPPATLLGAVVKTDVIDPMEHEGSIQRIHIQFLVIDDVSQRILVRTLRQLQDVMDRDEWMHAQQLLQKMRRNKIQNIGSPAASASRKETTRTKAARPSNRVAGSRTGSSENDRKSTSRITRTSTRTMRRTGTAGHPATRISTRSMPRAPAAPPAPPPKPPAARGGQPSTRSYPNAGKPPPEKPESSRRKPPSGQ